MRFHRVEVVLCCDKFCWGTFSSRTCSTLGISGQRSSQTETRKICQHGLLQHLTWKIVILTRGQQPLLSKEPLVLSGDFRGDYSAFLRDLRLWGFFNCLFLGLRGRKATAYVIWRKKWNILLNDICTNVTISGTKRSRLFVPDIVRVLPLQSNSAKPLWIRTKDGRESNEVPLLSRLPSPSVSLQN